MNGSCLMCGNGCGSRLVRMYVHSLPIILLFMCIISGAHRSVKQCHGTPSPESKHLNKGQPPDLEMDADVISLSDEDNTKGEKDVPEEEKGDEKEELLVEHQVVTEEVGKTEAAEFQSPNSDEAVNVNIDEQEVCQDVGTANVRASMTHHIDGQQQFHQQQHQHQPEQPEEQQVEGSALPRSQVSPQNTPLQANNPTSSATQQQPGWGIPTPSATQQQPGWGIPQNKSQLQDQPHKKKKNKLSIKKVKGLFERRKKSKRKKNDTGPDASLELANAPTDASNSDVASIGSSVASGVESIAKLCLVDDDDSSSCSSTSSANESDRPSSLRTLPPGSEYPLGTQERNLTRDGQLATAVASSLEGFDEWDGACVVDGDDEEDVIPKVTPQKLDTSQTLVIKNDAPQIAANHSRCSYISPTENYYDLLVIHSECKKDWKEVDSIKRIAKKYNWKVISMHEFPAGMSQFEIFSTMLGRCTYSMLLLTKHFFTDVWCQHRYAACLTAAIQNHEHKWSVIPVVYRDSGYETPLELATIAGLQRKARYFHNNLRSSVSSGRRREREEAIGVYSEPSPPVSPPSTPPPLSPPLSPRSPAEPTTPVEPTTPKPKVKEPFVTSV